MKTPKPSIDFDFRQLEIFCRVAEAGSFSEAAKQVFLAQASVSERIASLENMVNTRLLDRQGRQVTLTKAGELLYRRALDLLELKKNIALELEAFLGHKGGQIEIGGSTIPGEYILPEHIGRFSRQFPDIFVNLLIADTDEIETKVLDGRLELAVTGSKPSNRNFAIKELWKDELVLAVPAGHAWAGLKEIGLKELVQMPFIARENGSGTLRMVNESLAKSRLKSPEALKVVARLGSSTAVKQGIKSGLGVSILSKVAVAAELAEGSLKALKIKGLDLGRSFYLICDRRRTVSPPCQAFLDFLLEDTGAER
ncbi:MAG: LysR family transcriptional regulator [Desulfobacteraceae bacterium]|nr:MAG: LysR family transcriptional regulator [Desulfobacteraceae bacterium]